MRAADKGRLRCLEEGKRRRASLDQKTVSADTMWPLQDERVLKFELDLAEQEIALLWPDTFYPDFYGATMDKELSMCRQRDLKTPVSPEYGMSLLVQQVHSFRRQNALLRADSAQAFGFCYSIPEISTGEEACSGHEHTQDSPKVNESAFVSERLPEPVYTAPDDLSTTSRKVCELLMVMHDLSPEGGDVLIALENCSSRKPDSMQHKQVSWRKRLCKYITVNAVQ
jgi:hypothetical protein